MSTVKLEHWRGHVLAAQKQGLPLSHYARKHGISRYTLYAAQRQLRHAGGLPVRRSGRRKVARAKAGPFVAVQVIEPPPSALRARLRNGVEVEFGGLDARACATVVAMLAALPCSG